MVLRDMTGRITLAAVALLLALPVSALGQARLTGADLGGNVIDQTEALVPAARITVTNVDTNIARTVVTDDKGHYDVPALPPGTYTVSVALAGFTTQTREGVVLLLGQSVTIDFKLTLAMVLESATAAAEVPLVQVSRTELSSVVSRDQIERLPSNGRNFMSFSVITPGVSIDHTPQQGVTTTSGLSFTGQRGRSNNVMVDGLDNNDPVVGAVRATFSQEAVREFQVLADSYSAEFGKSAGGVVNIVTKSGTNAFHGNAFYYFRDRSLNAKSYFEQFDTFGNPVNLEKAPFRQQQGGATLGGPIRKDRSFFFLSYEGTDAKDSRLVTIDPTAAAVLNSVGFPVELGNVPLNVRNNELLGKVDHQLSSNHALVLRGNLADITREGIDDFGGIVARSRGTVQLRTDWSLSAAETAVFARTWISEARAQYAYERQNVQALDPLCGGECTEVDQGGPTLEVTGVASVGRQRVTPQLRVNRRLQLLETLSFFTGAHQFKAGGEYNHLAFPGDGNTLPLHFGGRYIFSPIPALGVTSSLDGLQKGTPAAYVQGYGNSTYSDIGYADLALFAQDQWKVGRAVIKPGVRYQRQFWQPYTYSVSDVGAGTLSYPLPSDGNNVAPRMAVAYDLAGNGNTVLRGAYGIFYDQVITALSTVGRIVNGAQDGVRTLVLSAPRAAIAWNAPSHRLSEDQAKALVGNAYPSTVTSLDPALKTSYTHQASIGIDRALGHDLALSVSGVYVRGYNMPGTIDYNPVVASLGSGRRPNDSPCAANPAATCVNGGIPGTSASVLQYTSFGESWYKGLMGSLRKRFSHGSQFLLSYTLSKAEDTATDFQSTFIVQNSGFGRDPNDKFGLPVGFDPQSERGPATHDQRHRLVVSGFYQLPWKVQLSGIVSAASGHPFSPLAGADLNGDGNGGSFPPDRARRDPASESTSVGRNSETTVAIYNVDMRASKTWTFGKTRSIEVMFEVFNLLNHTNFFEDTNQSSFVIFGSGAFPAHPLPAYGRYTGSLPPRQAQLAARFSF